MSKKLRKGVLHTELTFGERIALLGLLPAEGSIATLRLVRETRENLSAKEAELKRLNVKFLPDGRLQWEADKDKPRGFSFGGFVLTLVIDKLKKLDGEGKLHETQASLWDKFIGGDGKESGATGT